MKTALAFFALSAAIVAQTTVLSWTGATSSEHLGGSLAAPGDLNGDGTPDIVLGSPDALDLVAIGSVTARSGFDGSVIWQAFGAPGDRFGATMAVAGDVNADGRADIILSAPGGIGLPGYARILSGADGSTIRSFAGFIGAVDGGRDFNGDGTPDQLYAYSAPGGATGGVDIVSGVDGSVLAAISPSSSWIYGGLGSVFRATFVADVHDDGFDDVVVARGSGGPVIAFRGPSGSPAGAVDDGGSTSPLLVDGIDDVGSLTYDAHDDVGVSWFGWPPPFGNGLSWYRTYNSATGAMIWEIQTLPANPATPGAGVGKVARFPDLDGDGKPELVFGGGSPAGATIVSGASGATLLAVSAPFSFFQTQGSVATIGDITGDGVPEFAYGYGSNTTGGFVAVVSPVSLGGAAVANLGGSCGSFSTALTATPPVLGASATVSVAAGPPSVTATLLIDVAADVSTPYGSCVFHLDLAHLSDWVQMPLALDGMGSASLGVMVPSVPSLTQHPVTMQLFIPGTTSPLGFDLSNGLRATLGY